MCRPPGTGKTSTICGLIFRFLSTQPRPPVPIVVGKPETRFRGPVSRILVCAPSNAAIDEVAQRIKDGCKRFRHGGRAPNVVRIGTAQAMGNSVKDISLDYIVDQKLDGQQANPDIGHEIQELRVQLDQLKQSRRDKIAQLNNAAPTLAVTLENDIKVLSSRRQTLATKLDQLKDRQKADGRTLDTLRRNTQREVLLNADIICSTLSGSGHEILENLEFDMVVIDEAAQAIELSSLIPLKYGCSKCVMVGDPQQLPPTVISQEVRTPLSVRH
jgi:senataxin